MKTDETTEQHSLNSSETKKCRYCKQVIHPEALKCHNCGAYQGILRFFFDKVPLLISIILVFVALAQVTIGYIQMKDAEQKQIEALKALEKASKAELISSSAAKNVAKFVAKSEEKFSQISEILDHVEKQSNAIDLIKIESESTLNTIKEMQQKLYAMKKYGGIGKVDFNGKIQLGGGTSTASQLYNWSKGFVKLQINHEKGRWKLIGEDRCTPLALKQYKSIIKQYPFWPFSHYVLATCLKSQGENSWEIHAQKALKILKGVTEVPGHDLSYTVILNATQKLLQE